MRIRSDNRRLRTVRLGAAVCALVMLIVPGAAWGAGEAVIQNGDFSEYPTVRLTVSLPAELLGGAEPQFTVTENGSEVTGLGVEREGRDAEPVDVVLAIDTSGSMEGEPLDSAKEAAVEFVDTLKASSRVALVTFGTRPTVVSAFTDDRSQLAADIGALGVEGETALFDAVSASAELARTSGVNVAGIVVLSDGGDTASRGTLEDTVSAVNAAGVPIFAVALPSYEADPVALETLARQSGGRLVALDVVAGLPELYRGIAAELQDRFVLSFTSARPRTADLEIAVTARSGDQEASAVSVWPNPLLEEPVGAAYEPFSLPVAQDLAQLSVATALIWGSFALLIAAVALFFIRPRSTLPQLRYYGQLQQEGGGAPGLEDADPDSMRNRMMGAVEYVAGRRGFTETVSRQLARAGLPLRPVEYISAHLALVVGLGVLFALMSGRFIVGVLAIILATVLPMYAISWKAARRTSRFEEQLPELLNLIAGSLRSGWGMLQAIDVVVEEALPPASEEFRRVQTEARLGLPVEDALRSMAARVGSEDFTWTVSAIAIQREVGGNLAEVLDIVSDTLRERAALRRQVQALTAEGRLSAIILSILPFGLLLVLSLLNPSYVGLLYTTTPGLIMLAGGALALVIGIIWLSRVTRVEV